MTRDQVARALRVAVQHAVDVGIAAGKVAGTAAGARRIASRELHQGAQTYAAELVLPVADAMAEQALEDAYAAARRSPSPPARQELRLAGGERDGTA